MLLLLGEAGPSSVKLAVVVVLGTTEGVGVLGTLPVQGIEQVMANADAWHKLEGFDWLDLDPHEWNEWVVHRIIVRVSSPYLYKRNLIL